MSWTTSLSMASAIVLSSALGANAQKLPPEERYIDPILTGDP